MKNEYLLTVPFSFIALSGCSLFTQPMADPVITEHFDTADGTHIRALAATADRRLVVFYPNSTVCMEQPPDISENISASLTNQFSASAKTAANDTASANAAVAMQIASALSYATKPSQGLMLYRTGMADLCNEFANKVITSTNLNQYYVAANSMLKKAVALTTLELLLTNGTIGPQGFVTQQTKPDTGTGDTTGTTDTKDGAVNPAAPNGAPAAQPPAAPLPPVAGAHGGAPVAPAAQPPATPLPPVAGAHGGAAGAGHAGVNPPKAPGAAAAVVQPPPKPKQQTTPSVLSDAQKDQLIQAIVADLLKDEPAPNPPANEAK